jgi:hypothetical protein
MPAARCARPAAWTIKLRRRLSVQASACKTAFVDFIQLGAPTQVVTGLVSAALCDRQRPRTGGENEALVGAHGEREPELGLSPNRGRIDQPIIVESTGCDSGSKEDLSSAFRLESSLKDIGLEWDDVCDCTVSTLGWLAAV